MNDGVTTAQLASMLLAVVVLLLAAKRAAQRRLRFASNRAGGQTGAADGRPLPLRRSAAVSNLACYAPCRARGRVLRWPGWAGILVAGKRTTPNWVCRWRVLPAGPGPGFFGSWPQPHCNTAGWR
ncbi:MAG: hypothetical protein IPH51_12710 [Rubrivivax sp.]|nr:hypothetical protein [Rubrivivax sp.]